MHPSSTDVVVLCGGFGTRLQPLFPDIPKVLAPIGGEVFLDVLLRKLEENGFRKIVLCVGQRRDQVKTYVIKKGYDGIIFSEEEEPLGTGGALRHAMNAVDSETLLVLNGDTLAAIDFTLFLQSHEDRRAFLSFGLVKGSDLSKGGVSLDEEGFVREFKEKSHDSVLGYLSAGVYLCNRRIGDFFPQQDSFSLEGDVFPVLVEKERCFGFVMTEPFLEIGTPEGYIHAERILGVDR